MTVSESLEKLVSLTRQNMQILQALNEAFYSKNNHITASVNGAQYTIPSYVSLENKVIQLQDSFDSLVKCTKSGEAWLNFDGNSKEIRTSSYQAAPNPLESLKNASSIVSFSTEQSTVLKDMLTPVPYLNIDVSELNDDITQVSVRKLVPTSTTCKNAISTRTVSGQPCAAVSYQDINSIIISNTDYKEGTDYTLYDKTYDIPLRNCSEQGTYIVSEVISDTIDASSAVEVLEVTIANIDGLTNPLIVYDLDGTSYRDLKIGDYLTTYDGSAKLEVTKIYRADRRIQLTVLSGEYVNINANSSDTVTLGTSTIEETSVLNFFATPSDDRYVHIPLEEDEYVYIAVAPVNPRRGIRSAWDTGILVKTHELYYSSNPSISFEDYYNDNVKNIGDTLTELSTIMAPAITRYSQSDFNTFKTAPTLTSKTLEVVRINRHLDDSKSVQLIKSYYSQKLELQADLQSVQEKISQIQSDLASTSFDDKSGMKYVFESQLKTLRSQQSEISKSITSIINQIAQAAADADVPLENGKYRVRGYVDVEQYLKDTFGNTNNMDYVLKVQTRYKYRNSVNPTANIQVIGSKYLFTDYDIYEPPISREKTMSYYNGNYTSSVSEYSATKNEIKFNQIDIPITQGEQVILQSRIIWAFGYPFVTMATDWSDALTVSFPDNLKKDVEVLTIIEENNNDIETNRFTSILENEGVTDHINSQITDQDITYYHNASDIASGQYTAERRIIPLKDMISTILSDIKVLQAEVQGAQSSALSVELIYNGTAYDIEPSITNVVSMTPYQSLSTNQTSGEYLLECTNLNNTKIARSGAILKISNKTAQAMHLYPLILGSRDTVITELGPAVNIERSNTIGINAISYYSKQYSNTDHNTDGSLRTVLVMNENTSGIDLSEQKDFNPSGNYDNFIQKGNQYILFRTTNAYTGKYLNSPEFTQPASGNDKNDLDAGVSTYAQMAAFLRSRNSTVVSGPDAYAMGPFDSGSGTMFDKGYLFACPYTKTKNGLCITSDSSDLASYTLAPNQSLSVNIDISYWLPASGASSTDALNSASYTLAFDIRNSLYRDPNYYEIKFVANYSKSTLDTNISNRITATDATRYSTVVR